MEQAIDVLLMGAAGRRCREDSGRSVSRIHSLGKCASTSGSSGKVKENVVRRGIDVIAVIYKKKQKRQVGNTTYISLLADIHHMGMVLSDYTTKMTKKDLKCPAKTLLQSFVAQL